MKLKTILAVVSSMAMVNAFVPSENFDIKNDYIEMITSNINLGNKKLKVIYDCGNGTTSIVADDIFNKFCVGK